jgi:hypothetical protein
VMQSGRLLGLTLVANHALPVATHSKTCKNAGGAAGRTASSNKDGPAVEIRPAACLRFLST